MSLICWRCVGRALYEKMKTPHLFIIWKEMNIKGMTYAQTERKQMILYYVYEHLKSPPRPVHSSYFASYPILVFLISHLKCKLLSKFWNDFIRIQKLTVKIICLFLWNLKRPLFFERYLKNFFEENRDTKNDFCEDRKRTTLFFPIFSSL